jgi:hypothetical protein
LGRPYCETVALTSVQEFCSDPRLKTAFPSGKYIWFSLIPFL